MQGFFYILERLFYYAGQSLGKSAENKPGRCNSLCISRIYHLWGKYITTVVLKVPNHKAFKVMVVLKVLGVLIGLFGLYTFIG